MTTTELRFERENIRVIGWMAGTTAYSYAVFEGDDEIGQVNVPSVVSLVSAGTDVEQWIADKLNWLLGSITEEQIRNDLSVALQL